MFWRGQAAVAFFELLGLHAKGFVTLDQPVPFGDISIAPQVPPTPQERSVFIAEQPESAPHMLRILPHTVPRVGRSYEHFPDGFDRHLLPFSRLLASAHQKERLG